MAAIAPVAAAAVSTKPASVDVRTLPALRSEQARPEKVADVKPAADFTPLEGERSRLDNRRSRVVSRSAFADEYVNPDGTRTLVQSTQPRNMKDSAGVWQPIDAGLREEPSSKRLKAVRHQLNPSLAEFADDKALVSVEVDGVRASLALENAARGKRAKASGVHAEYADVAPDTDLTYEVTPNAVKETIRLRKAPAQGKASWRFRLDTAGLTPSLSADGSVALADAAGAVKIVMPPIETWDSSETETQAPAQTGGTYGLERVGSGWVLTVSVDEAWLRDPKRVYPVNIDPTFSYGLSESYAYRSDSYSCTACGVKIGNSQAAGDTYFRTLMRFNYSPVFGQNVVGVWLDVDRIGGGSPHRAWNADLWHGNNFNYNGFGAHLASAPVGDVGTFNSPALTALVKSSAAGNDYTYFMLTGTETAGTFTYKNLNATLHIDTGSAPPAPVLVAPVDNSVSTSLTPTLSVNPVTDADGDAVKYCFTVATGADGKSGMVVDSGCATSPSWTVPDGVLSDGVAYTWKASTYSGYTKTTGTWTGHFKVDQRIGAHGPSPVDSVGPVTVNLANGNVSTSASSPTFTTVGGTAGVSLAYNSQQPESKGVKASYFHDISHAGLINDAIQTPVLVRNESQINADWGTASPFPPVLGQDWWLVRWEGFFIPPVTGTYQFAGLHDDGPVIWINGQKVYDVATPRNYLDWAAATGVALTAGQAVPIKVELQEITNDARMKLYTRTTDGTTVPSQIVPADWLATTDSPALPKGWTLSADLDGSGAGYTEAKVADQTIVLTDATGAKHTWTKKSEGGYTPPQDEIGVLSLNSNGQVTLSEGADIYVFRPDGKLDSQSSVQDSRKPAALQNIYNGTPSRLVQIKDPVSNRAHTLFYNRPGEDCYGGASVPAGFDALAPAQMLCRITYWDSTQTRLWYVGGRLARIEDPGSELTDYAYNADGLLSGVRDNLAADWVAADPATRGSVATSTTITYDGGVKPKATAVTAPVPAVGQARPGHTYTYDVPNRTTKVNALGLVTATGWATKVVYDGADRTLSSTDATGKTSSQTWSVKDQKLTTTDPAGRVSTTVYDAQDRPVDSYGPAPASCFTGQVPTAACASTVPKSHTNYDEGINSLSVAYYDNRHMLGAPKAYTTSVSAGANMVRDWGNGAPDPAIPADNWSARFTGEIEFPNAGTYTLSLWADDGVRMWVGEQMLINDWIETATKQRTATYVSPSAGHRAKVRIEYFDATYQALFHLNWIPPGGVEQNIPLNYLHPRYDLTTSTVTSESGGVVDSVASTSFNENGLDSTFGLATSATTAGLISRSGYEPVGTGFLRKTSKTMPTGAQTSYVYYGDTEARDNPCTPAADAVNQGGMAKLTTMTAPATGSARTDEQVYDLSGRVVARATSGDWSCTTYDARDRVVTQMLPANVSAGARTITTNYAVGGDPLTTSVADYNGTVTTQVDLLGRVIAYTDANGLRTETTYNQAGRVTLEKVIPPNAADPAQEMTNTYDDAGRVLTTKLGTTTLSTSTYDAAGELATVAYSNGSSLSAVGKDTAGRVTSQTWKTSDNVSVTSTVTRTRAGTVIDESLGGVDARPGASNYLYDAAGRLTEAWVPDHHFTYDFTSTAPAACPTGTRANAGLNTNRVRLLDETTAGTTETGYCYDSADRILATTGASAITGIQYNSHGSTTQYTQGSATTYFSWDSADRNIAIRTTGADPADVAYTRDATDRITRRQATSGDTVTDIRYGFTGSGDSAEYAMNGADKKLLTRSISLPGGVLYTWKPIAADQTWDHPTVRGDLCLTTVPNGIQTGPWRVYGPYGEAVTGQTATEGMPDNQPGQMDYGWLGQHQRPQEHAGALSIIQMGARPYSPALGRFLSVDPVDGGSSNDYDYVYADPINTVDIDGRCPMCIPLLFAAVRAAGPWIVRTAIPWITRTALPWAGRLLLRGGRALVGRVTRVVRGGSWRSAMSSAAKYGKGAAKFSTGYGATCLTVKSVIDKNNSRGDSYSDAWACMRPTSAKWFD
ncbi:PA14 domain-containing protein [Actinokineospora sp. HUAS TT18]|uniref:PA14 domain-containing protein n=1 Tax=Actinokineospora sp. HUAS TT18 TaxID=3447451 RepID=UPI003F528C36